MKKRIRSFGATSTSATKNRKVAIRPLVGFASALLCGAVLAFAQPVAAQPQDDSYDALRQFAREVGIDQPPAAQQPQAAAQPAPHGTKDEAYSALLDFARMVDPEAAKTVAAEGAQPSKAAPKKAAVKSKQPAIKENKGGDGDAYFVGSNKCMTCHAAVAAEFANTLMGKIGKTTRKGTMECENCHGPGSKHVSAGGGRGVGGMNSFKGETAQEIEENNAVCLTCHERGDRNNWRGSTHETRGLSCTNCHTVMRNVTPKNQLALPVEADVCFQCHKNKRAEIWRTSHMPIREGKMTCSNCHNPHGSYSEANLREATVNDNCYKCHAEKRGPFLWEHPPVREDCLNCHDPHGSNNDFLLKISRPRLCQQCHSGGQHNSNPRNPFNTLYAQNRECQHCHSAHHGSNNPAGARFMR